ncbi:MAG: NAD(P)H-dependent oxidoreductase [Bradymonadia bacterium]
MTAKRIVALLGHPSEKSFNAALLETYVDAAASAGAEIRVHHAGAMQFDPVLRVGYAEVQPLEPDLVTLQRDIEWCDHFVVFAPLWWGSVPAGLKGIFDRAFLPGWGFRFEEGKSLPTQLLKGRTARLVLTMDSPKWWYWLNFRGAAHGAVVQGTLKFVGFDTSTTLLAKVGSISPEKRADMLRLVARQGQAEALSTPSEKLRRLHARSQELRADRTLGSEPGT